MLNAKVKHSHELKRKLGITVWKEFREDMEQNIRNIQETSTYVLNNDRIILCLLCKLSGGGVSGAFYVLFAVIIASFTHSKRRQTNLFTAIYFSLPRLLFPPSPR